MKFRRSLTVGEFCASYNPGYTLIAPQIRRFCADLAVPSVLFLAAFFLPVGESVGAVTENFVMDAVGMNANLLVRPHGYAVANGNYHFVAF